MDKSTACCSGQGANVGVDRRLVEIPREKGLENIGRLLASDMLNRYQAKSLRLNFLLQSERAFAKFVGMKYACALNSGGIAISFGLEAMKRMLFPADSCSDVLNRYEAEMKKLAWVR